MITEKTSIPIRCSGFSNVAKASRLSIINVNIRSVKPFFYSFKIPDVILFSSFNKTLNSRQMGAKIFKIVAMILSLCGMLRVDVDKVHRFASGLEAELLCVVLHSRIDINGRVSSFSRLSKRRRDDVHRKRGGGLHGFTAGPQHGVYLYQVHGRQQTCTSTYSQVRRKHLTVKAL